MPEMPPDQEAPVAPSSKEAMNALISKRIDEAFTRNALASNATLDNLGSISEQKNINLDSMDRHERADAVKILSSRHGSRPNGSSVGRRWTRLHWPTASSSGPALWILYMGA